MTNLLFLWQILTSKNESKPSWLKIKIKVKIDNNKLTAIQEQLLCSSPSFEDFSILTSESNDFKLKIMESILIARDKPILNKADSSFPLELFQCNISGYHMFYTTYDVHLSHCAYVIVVYSIFIITLRVLYFIKKQNVRAFIIILGLTMKAVAFES